MLAAKDDASLSLVATSGGLGVSTKSCGLNAGVLRTQRSYSCSHCYCDFLEWESSFARSVRMQASSLDRSNCENVLPQTSVETTLSARRDVGPGECLQITRL